MPREPRKIEFLWVRWFGRELSTPGGFERRRLHRIGVVEENEPTPFGFLDASLVIRGVHLIPAFHLGQTNELLGQSRLREAKGEDDDWRIYYVNMYVILRLNLPILIYQSLC